MSYKRLPGTARRYLDTSTGETISRAERDKRVGALFESGFKSYGQRAKSEHTSGIYQRKDGDYGLKYTLHGVSDTNKAINYLIKQIGASDTSFYSVRIKTKDDKWLSVATSTSDSISQNIANFTAKYNIEQDDIEDIEFVVLT